MNWSIRPSLVASSTLVDTQHFNHKSFVLIAYGIQLTNLSPDETELLFQFVGFHFLLHFFLNLPQKLFSDRVTFVSSANSMSCFNNFESWQLNLGGRDKEEVDVWGSRSDLGEPSNFVI